MAETKTQFTATWHGFSWSFEDAKAAERWISKLQRLYRQDSDAAERLAYQGPAKA